MHTPIQAALNGGRAGAPATPEALAAAARAVMAAGAASIHLHPRDAAGRETLAPAAVAAAMRAVRAAAPGLPLGIGTGAWIAPGGSARHADIAGWYERPDFVSVNLHEADAETVMACVAGQGIGIEAGIWSTDDAARLERVTAPFLRVLIEMPDVPPAAAITEAEACLDLVADRAPVLLHGEGQSAWAMVGLAAARGVATRAGLEDMNHLPDGTPTNDNVAIFAAAMALTR